VVAEPGQHFPDGVEVAVEDGELHRDPFCPRYFTFTGITFGTA
jgi:hypothetical protein